MEIICQKVINVFLVLTKIVLNVKIIIVFHAKKIIRFKEMNNILLIIVPFNFVLQDIHMIVCSEFAQFACHPAISK